MTVLFFREGFFYHLELPDDAVIEDHVKCNPGTLMVENALTGERLWPKENE